MSGDQKLRKDDKWYFNPMAWRAIEAIVAIAVIYGVATTTIKGLEATTGTLCKDMRVQQEKVTVLETKFDYIAKALDKIDGKLEARR